jgi:hypothetical protein
MIAEATEPGQRTHAYALLTTALAVGNMGAGLIADTVGHSGLRWLFVVDAASCLACALIVRLALPAGDRRPASQQQLPSLDEGLPMRIVVSPWRDPRLLAMTAAGTVFALVYMLILVALPLSLSARGLNPASAGLVMATATLTLVVTRPVLRIPLIAGLSGQVACGTGFALMGAGLAGYAIAHSLAGLLAPTAIWSAGNLLLSGRAFAVVTALAPPGTAARYLAVYGLSWGIATVAAPVLATQVIGSLGPAALWSGSAVLCAAMSCGQPAVMRAVMRRSQVPAGAPGNERGWLPGTVVSQAGVSGRSDSCDRDHDEAGEKVQVACDQLQPGPVILRVNIANVGRGVRGIPDQAPRHDRATTFPQARPGPEYHRHEPESREPGRTQNSPCAKGHVRDYG